MAGMLPYGAEVHDQLFSEDQEAADAALEIKACLATSDISRALTTCDRMLALHPESRLFEGLRLEVENREREARLEFIRQLSADLDNEPDLDARINAIQQALNRYPNESQLLQLLRNAAARRDLFNALIGEARHDEISDNYDAALKRWSLLRELYPGVRGIEHEVHRVEALVGNQRKMKRRAEFVDAIFTLSSTGDYTRAVFQCVNALAEYPNDAGLLALKASIEEKALHATELQKCVSDGLTFLQGQELDAALECFNKARTLDQNNLQVRYLIGIALLEKARAVMAEDRRKLSLLLEEARSFIPGQSDLPRVPFELNAPSDNWENSLVRVQPPATPEPAAPLIEHNDAPAVPEAQRPAAEPQSEQPEPAYPEQREVVDRIESVVENPLFHPAPVSRRPSMSPRRFVVFGLVLIGAFLVGWVVYANQPGSSPGVSPPVSLDIKASPEGAQIFVDGNKVGESQVRAQIHRGSHVISASLAGYDSQTLSVDIGSAAKAVQIDLQPTLLDVRFVTDAATGTIWIDDEFAGEISGNGITIPGIKPGIRTVRMSTSAGEVEMSFEFSPGKLPIPKSLPLRQIADVLFIGSVDGKSRVECNCAPAGLRIGEVAELIRPDGLEVALGEGEHAAELWLGKNHRNLTVFAGRSGGQSPAVTIAVFSAPPIANP